MELKYQQAVTLRENGQYEEAIAAFCNWAEILTITVDNSRNQCYSD